MVQDWIARCCRYGWISIGRVYKFGRKLYIQRLPCKTVFLIITFIEATGTRSRMECIKYRHAETPLQYLSLEIAIFMGCRPPSYSFCTPGYKSHIIFSLFPAISSIQLGGVSISGITAIDPAADITEHSSKRPWIEEFIAVVAGRVFHGRYEVVDGSIRSGTRRLGSSHRTLALFTPMIYPSHGCQRYCGAPTDSHGRPRAIRRLGDGAVDIFYL